MAAYFTVDGILFDDQDDRRDYQVDNPNHGPIRRFKTKKEAEKLLTFF
jgi:hypothetical protein